VPVEDLNMLSLHQAGNRRVRLGC